MLEQARDLIDAAQPTEPWEILVAQLLRAHCRPAQAPPPRADLDQAQHAAAALLADPEPSTAVFQIRAGLTALELDTDGRQSSALGEALADAAGLDAYAAREVLHHPPARAALSAERASALDTVVEAAGLGAGALAAAHLRDLSESVTLGEAELKRLLRVHDAALGNPPKEVPQPT